MLIFSKPSRIQRSPVSPGTLGRPLCSLCSSYTEQLSAPQICQIVSGFHVFAHITPSAFPSSDIARKHPTPHSRFSFQKLFPDPSLSRTDDSSLGVPGRSCLSPIMGSVTLYWIYLFAQMSCLLDCQPFDTRHVSISVFTVYLKLYTWHLIAI